MKLYNLMHVEEHCRKATIYSFNTKVMEVIIFKNENGMRVQ